MFKIRNKYNHNNMQDAFKVKGERKKYSKT